MSLYRTGGRLRALGIVVPATLVVLLAAGAHAGDGSNPRSGGDPIEPVNRAIFWFNDKVDVFVLEPVARGWDWIAPDRVQKSVSNFFSNLRFPVVTVNDLLQAKILRAARDTGRFAVNTTVGVLGLFDPATGWGLEQSDEDFGQTLGYWGIPPGPYLVLPLLGPSNPRDGVGLIADYFAAVYPLFVGFEYTGGASALNGVNARAQVLEQVRDAKEASVDYYVFVRNAYKQRRERLVHDRVELPEEEKEELYFEEFDDEE